MTAAANYVSAADVFAGWRDEVLTGQPPTLYPGGSGELARIEIGPGLVTLLGGGPGAGKTALTMQLLTDALRLTPKLRALREGNLRRRLRDRSFRAFGARRQG